MWNQVTAETFRVSYLRSMDVLSLSYVTLSMNTLIKFVNVTLAKVCEQQWCSTLMY